MPFYLRTGKRLPKRTTEIAIQFKRPPLEIFKRVSASSVAPSLLIINVQPDEGISCDSKRSSRARACSWRP